MTAVLYKFFSAFVAIVCFFSNMIGLPAAEKIESRQYEIFGNESCEAGGGRVSVHDPSIVQDKNGKYYVFGSHGCAAKSDDLRNWENVASGVNDSNRVLVPEGSTLRKNLSEPLSWTDAFQEWTERDEENWETNVWAADVIYNKTMGKYCYYACSSVWGTVQSVIWFGTSDSIEGPFENVKTVVYSGFGNQTRGKYVPRYPIHYSFTNIEKLLEKGVFSIKDIRNASWFNEEGFYDNSVYPNAIDPTVFYDRDDNLWMVYGSYSGGIYTIPLDEKTGLPDYKYMKKSNDYDIYFGKRIIKTNEMNEWTGEGPFITYDPVSDYYYLYITYCGLNALGGYNIREYRSEKPDGPFLDAAGNDATENVNSGVKLFGNYKFDCLETAYLAGGHSSSIVTDDGRMLQVYHTRFNLGNEWHQLRVHEMKRTENGWAVVLPFECSGENVDSGFDEEAIAGEYEFIDHGTISNGCSDWADVEKIIAPTQHVSLNADGTISGVKVFEATKENTAVSSRDVNGTWSLKDGTSFITITVDGVSYQGVVTIQKEENGGGQRLVFSAVGENNECVWGVKR